MIHHHILQELLNLNLHLLKIRLRIKRTIYQAAGGKLRDKSDKESWALLEDLTLYDNESLNDLRDFAKPVKAISMPQDVPSTSNRRLIKLENQVQCLMEAHLAANQPIQVNKITYSCDICSGPHDTQYCMENPEQAFVDYASSRTNEVGDFKTTDQRARLPTELDTLLKDLNDRKTRALPRAREKEPYSNLICSFLPNGGSSKFL
ncbi:hypothetical protein Tco_0877371 [Tanacetum coccineum]|uniref:MAK10-like protein n=1 Tax=Tanacetum coccineum TaxID=301880 RepID=A0ABQ5BUZ4_9ASTR